jgi:hypothetical protein
MLTVGSKIGNLKGNETGNCNGKYAVGSGGNLASDLEAKQWPSSTQLSKPRISLMPC